MSISPIQISICHSRVARSSTIGRLTLLDSIGIGSLRNRDPGLQKRRWPRHHPARLLVLSLTTTSISSFHLKPLLRSQRPSNSPRRSMCQTLTHEISNTVWCLLIRCHSLMHNFTTDCCGMNCKERGPPVKPNGEYPHRRDTMQSFDFVR